MTGVGGTVKDALEKTFGPVRHIVPGLALLLLIALTTMAAGMYNVFVLPYHGDRSILFMLAVTVYPGPYVFYALSCLFLFHAHGSRLLTQIYYASCALFVAAPAVLLLRRMKQLELSFPQRLDEALFDNLIASVAIGTLSFGAMLAVVLGARWLYDDSD